MAIRYDTPNLKFPVGGNQLTINWKRYIRDNIPNCIKATEILLLGKT